MLVALYKEEGQADDLVVALAKLDWPREKLEIKLICEADDHKTINAVRAAIGRSWIRYFPPHLRYSAAR